MNSPKQQFPPLDWRGKSPEVLLARVRDAGIVGMGGAGFPTHLKLQAALQSDHRTVVANGVETDPGVTADRALLKQKGSDVLEGIGIVARILNASSSYLAVSNQSIAERLRICNDHDIAISVIDNDYQNGEERVLIEKITGEPISQDSYPAHNGIAVLNVATLFAICECVRDGLAVTKRIATVLGKDQWCEIDTPVHELANTSEKLRVGSFANGRSVKDQDTLKPIHNAISINLSSQALPCIRCGWCDSACPKDLPVERLLSESMGSISSPTAQTHLNECNDCGACVVSCPSRIPIIDYIRESRDRQNESGYIAQRANEARQRFEAKQQRIDSQNQRTMDERERRMQQEHKWQ
ncbi:MAG: hypothetical protein OXG24_11820 [Gammaproteobacteria bacterium]|nr:hypothetical protein [Gammaproteobacteria bacterium]